MSEENQIKKSRITPKDVMDVIYSKKTLDFNTEIEKKYKLNPKQIRQLAIIEGEIFEKKIPINEFLVAIKTKLGIDTETARLIAYEVCQNLFIPVVYYFPGIKEFMNQLKSSSSRPTDPNIIDLSNQ